jgi:PII-like signaling protein
MNDLTGKQTLLRIFLSEHDKFQHKPTYLQILELLRKKKIAGATVLRGVAGFGAKSHIHNAAILDISNNLPLVIEAVDTEQAIRAVLPKLDPMIAEGLVTLETVEVIRYKPVNKPH